MDYIHTEILQRFENKLIQIIKRPYALLSNLEVKYDTLSLQTYKNYENLDALIKASLETDEEDAAIMPESISSQKAEIPDKLSSEGSMNVCISTSLCERTSKLVLESYTPTDETDREDAFFLPGSISSQKAELPYELTSEGSMNEYISTSPSERPSKLAPESCTPTDDRKKLLLHLIIREIQNYALDNAANRLKSISSQKAEIPGEFSSDGSTNEYISPSPCERTSKLVQKAYIRTVKDMISQVLHIQFDNISNRKTDAFYAMIEMLIETDKEDEANMLKYISSQKAEIPDELPSDGSMNENISTRTSYKMSNRSLETYTRQHEWLEKWLLGAILNKVQYGAPEAFDALIKALQETDNEVAANMLKSISSQKAEIPDELPSDGSMNEYIFVRPSDNTSKLVQDLYTSRNVYSMITPIRGRCIVISNKTFSGKRLDERHGTEKDENALETLFTQLHFEVIIHRNKTVQEMSQILKQEGKREDHKYAKCFICVICSHGDKKGIYGVDGKRIKPEDVEECFDGQNCPALISKPKLFFFQACQGVNFDVGVDVTSEDSGPDLDTLSKSMKHPPNADRPDAAAPFRNKIKVAVKHDILIASATHPGYVSWRNETYGSWFIQAVVYVFSRYAAEKHILDLLTLVNRLMANMGRAKRFGQEPHMQAARSITSLQKDLFFFPNILEIGDKKK